MTELQGEIDKLNVQLEEAAGDRANMDQDYQALAHTLALRDSELETMRSAAAPSAPAGVRMFGGGEDVLPPHMQEDITITLHDEPTLMTAAKVSECASVYFGLGR